MEIFKLKPADLDIGDVQAVTALTFGHIDKMGLEFTESLIFNDLSMLAEYCANVVTDAIARCV